jgi:hypothetical protein
MTRQQALEKVAKLRVLAEDHAAQPGEVTAARARIKALTERYDLAKFIPPDPEPEPAYSGYARQPTPWGGFGNGVYITFFWDNIVVNGSPTQTTSWGTFG